MSTQVEVELTYRSLSPRFGAELDDVSLVEMSDADVEALQQLAAERGVVVVRNQGGDTLFCDMYQALETLSDAMQSFLARLGARHDPKGHHLYLADEQA